MIKLQLLRNATLVLEINQKTILVDPMLGARDSYPAFPGTGNENRNPLVDLPLEDTALNDLLSQTDMVLLSHTHLDHWDPAAQERLRKDIPLFCQPADEGTLAAQGFSRVTAVRETLVWEGITISRTGGAHGTGAIGQRMGTVSGYVLRYRDTCLYLAGDTIWCAEVQEAIDRYRPTHIVVNGGGARFTSGDPIVMDTKDVLQVCDYAPEARICVVHLEAVNHTKESRQQIKAGLAAHGQADRCLVPEDGTAYTL